MLLLTIIGGLLTIIGGLWHNLLGEVSLVTLLPVSVVHTPLDSVLQFVKLAVRSLALASRSREPSTDVRSACIILRAAQYTDYADSSDAQRKHRVGGEILSLAKVNRNEVAIFYGIVWNGIN